MIDGGLRPSRPTNRQPVYRQESVRRPEEETRSMEPAMPVEQPKPKRTVEVEPVPTSQRRSFGGLVKWLIVALLIIVLGVGGWFVWSSSQGSLASTIDEDKYQAVFLSNSQVYFGKLSVVNGDYMRLNNVFYLERQMTASANEEESTNDTETPTGDNNFQLLKYSDVLYGSEDEMIIAKSDIIRYENLRNDGVVAKAIANRR